MASFAKQFSLFLLLTLFSSLHTHARDSQFFNKVPSTTNNVVVPKTNEIPNDQPEEEQPNFLPENEKAYGLYGHESGQLPPSSTTAEPAATTATVEPTTKPQYNMESRQPVHKYLPKNYNPVAYVTEPEEINDNNENNNNYYNSKQNNYDTNQQEEENTEYRSYPATTNTRNNNNHYYSGGSSFNSQPQGMSDTRLTGSAAVNSRERYFNNGGEANGFRPQPQGMSDTRFVENGKYFYDVNVEKFSSNHPYESLRGVSRNEYSNRNYYGNRENTNAYGFDGETYQNPEEFQEEDTNMP